MADVEYEGKAKQLIPTEDPDIVIQRFKDDATAFNGEKFAQFEGKGPLNNAISTFFFSRLEEEGIATHFIGWENARDQKVHRLDIVPLEIVVRNIVAGSLKRRTGLPEGRRVSSPIVETYYKKDDLGDPLLCDCHVEMLDLVSAEDLAAIKEEALAINKVLTRLTEDANLLLVDFKLEFGYDSAGRLMLGDEISPDTCRLWDAETKRKMDKDVFRKDLGDLIETYEEVAERLGIETD